MKIEYWQYSGLNLDGTFEGDPENKQGSVCHKPKMDTSGLHHPNTRSAVESGLWLSVSTGRLPDGTMHGITIFFNDEAEMRLFEQKRYADFPPQS